MIVKQTYWPYKEINMAETPTLNDAQVRMRGNYEAATGVDASGFDWKAILAMIMSLLGGCVPKIARRHAIRHPNETKEIIHDHLLELPQVQDATADVDALTEVAYTEITTQPVAVIAAAKAESQQSA